ncbi:hypothetical protein [Xenorhabdus sp. TH1]|uniref:hypothetical protein n=1 Tax=Xenorhabdus sp. TH1 TaxID=3130166 RepID=UPI0030CB5CE6
MLRERLKHYEKLGERVDYVVIDGEKLNFKEMFVHDEPTNIAEMPLCIEKLAFLRQGVQKALAGFDNEFRAAMKKENLDAFEAETREFKREQALLTFALVKARSTLHEVATFAKFSESLGISDHSETLKYHGVLDMLDWLCEGDGHDRIEIYTNMLMVGTKILKGMLLEEKMLDVLEARTPEELEKTLNIAEQEIEEDIRLLNENKAN